MLKTIKTTAALMLVLFLITACNLPVNSTPTLEPEAAKTAAAQTVDALRTQIAGTLVPTQGQQKTVTQPPLKTQTTAPTNVPTATAIPATKTPVPSSTPIPIPCDRLDFVTDVTVPDNTVYSPNVTFTKTWRIKNSGSCSWTPSYKLVFVSGDSLNGPASVALPGNVNPGGTVDLSVSLKSGDSPRTYQGFWKLQNAGGSNFGWGANASQPFYVQIIVGTTATPTTAGFVVTSVQNVSASPNTWSGVCPFSTTLSADVTASAAGTATYYWVRSSDNAHSPTMNIDFSAAGTNHVTFTMSFTSSFAGFESLYIDYPNHQQFGNTALAIACTP